MRDKSNRFLRLPDLPDDILADMPDHVNIAFTGARRHGFEVEMICPGVQVPTFLRSRRRLVVVADDGDDPDWGPDAFDLDALGKDVRASRRAFVIAVPADPEIYAAAYAAAVEDLAEGSTVSLIVETVPSFRQDWLDMVMALRRNRTASARATALL
jgi:hypothetical protein